MQDARVDVVYKKFGLFLLFIYLIQEYAKPVWLSNLRLMIAVEVLLILFIFANIKNVAQILKERFYVLYGLLLLEMTIHGPTAANNYFAFWAWVLMATNLLFMIAISLSFRYEKYVVLFLNAFLLVHVIVSIDHLLYGKLYFAFSGFLNDSNDLAAGMVFVIPISFFLGISHSGFKRYIYIAATVLFVSVTVSSMSRGGFLGLAFVVLYSLYRLRSRLTALLSLLAIIVVFIAVVPDNYKNEILTIKTQGYESGTGRDRIELWKVAWRTFLDHPILGVGQGNQPWVWGEYQDPENTFFERGIGGRTVHSIFFIVLCELGIVGITLYAFMIYEILKKYRRWQSALRNGDSETKRDLGLLSNIATGLFIGFTGYLICGIFVSSFYYPQVWNVAGMFMGLDYFLRNNNTILARQTADIRSEVII